MSFTTDSTQFIFLWNAGGSQYAPRSNEFITNLNHMYRLKADYLEIDKENLFDQSLGQNIGTGAANKKKKNSYRAKADGSALRNMPEIENGEVVHLFLYGHSTYRRVKSTGKEERGISCNGHYISAENFTSMVNAQIEKVCKKGKPIFVWLLTCYGGSDDLQDEDVDIADDSKVLADCMVKTLNEYATLIAFDKAVTKRTLKYCRECATLAKENGIDSMKFTELLIDPDVQREINQESKMTIHRKL